MIVVGLMSDAAIEGIDVAVCELRSGPPEVLSSLSIPWPQDLRKMVVAARQPGMIDMGDICLLDVAVGEAFAAAALEGIANAGYYPNEVDLVGFKGLNIRHEIRKDGYAMASLQLGQASIVAEWTGITTIDGFRQRDMAAGGQGAPLIGYVDWLLLRHPTRCRAVVYLNRIASLVMLPSTSDTSTQPVAFEIGPGTALLDYVNAAANPEEAAGGAQADVAQALLDELLATPYGRRRPPKTLNEFAYSETMVAQVCEDARQMGVSEASLRETFMAFTTQTVADAVQTLVPLPVEEVIIGGQGCHDPLLVARLRQKLGGLPILTHEDIGMDTDSKLALGFAVLAYETWHNRPGTLPSLTGVTYPVVLGSIQPGKNYERLLRETWLMIPEPPHG
jgi:anhydro-N-acetylmuramic acid kinase